MSGDCHGEVCINNEFPDERATLDGIGINESMFCALELQTDMAHTAAIQTSRMNSPARNLED